MTHRRFAARMYAFGSPDARRWRAALLLALTSCTREDVTLLGPAPDAGTRTDDAGAVLDGECAEACLGLGSACSADQGCCSGLCRDRLCVADARCGLPGAECSAATACCSGRCEPTATGRTCTAFCRPTGAVCTRAADCCGYDCNDGRCAGPVCRQRNEDCKSDAECCSGTCSPQDGRCDDVEALSCRASFESCESGDGSACCHGCDEASQRCAPSESACRGVGEPCNAGAACCTGDCDALSDELGVCGGGCAPEGGACTRAGDCCSGLCAGLPGRCLAEANVRSCG